MHAWSHIEDARYAHSIEDYDESRQHYERAAGLHESTNSWSYLAPTILHGLVWKRLKALAE